MEPILLLLVPVEAKALINGSHLSYPSSVARSLGGLQCSSKVLRAWVAHNASRNWNNLEKYK
jgi:hypothetical protein